MKKVIFPIAMVLLVSGCASGINSIEKQELKEYELSGLMVEEKDPALATALGLLPGGGSFYTGEYGYGFLNLLAWPVSIFWDPISGNNAANAQNYTATKLYIAKLKEKELSVLDGQFKNNEINMKEYTLGKRKVESKYSLKTM